MKYLSKLLSMLLIGGMLFATGCTDYDQDIKDINRELNEINDQLNGRVNALAADLDAVEAALQGAIDEANQKVAENKEAIEDLKAVDAEHDAAIAEANEAIADAIAEIAALQEDIAALSEQHDADIEAVYAKIAEEVATVNTAIAAANEKISANETAIEDLKSKDAELAEDIEGALAAIQANVDDIAKNAENIQANADAIDAFEGDLLDLKNAFTAYQATTEAAIATLQSRMDTAEAAIDTLEDTVEQLAKMQEEQAGRIDDLEDDYEEFKKFTQDELAALTEADKALKQLIVNLENSFISYQQIVNEQFTKAFAEIAANTNAINALAAKHEEEVKSLQAQDAAILNTLDQHVAWLVELEENLQAVADRVTANETEINSIKGQIAKIQTNIEQMQVTIDALTQDLAELEKTLVDFQKQVNEQIVRLDAAIEKALDDAKAYADDAANAAVVEAKGYTDAVIEALTKSVESELGAIRTSIDQLNAYAVSIEEALNAYKESNEEALNGLKLDIDKILNRVQSIVFVPEYSDGKGTINYAKAGETLVETRSTMVYQVYPAECAVLIANTPAVEETVAPLSYNLEGLKTRGAEAQFNIVEVKGDLKGRLYVTFEPRNLGADFYAGKMEYAASLVLASETANLSTVYTNVVPAKTAEQISMAIMYGDKDITNKCYNPQGKAFDFVYTDTETVEKVLPEHEVVFTVGGQTYNGIVALNAAGYALEMVRGTYTERINNEHLGTRPFKVEEVEGLLQVRVSEVNKNLTYQPLYAGYTYAAGTLEVKACSMYNTVPVTADVVFDAVTATWTYAVDAAVDAAFVADEKQTEVVYSRQFDLAVNTNTLPEDTDLADVLATAPVSVVVTVDGKVEENVKASFNGDGTAYVAAVAGFAWGKNYEVKAQYEMKDDYGQVYLVVNVTLPVVTVDRSREDIELELETEQWMLTNFDFISKTEAESLEPIYEAVKADLGEMTAAEYLKDIFVNHEFVKYSITANDQNAEENDTKLVISNDGANITSVYNIAEYEEKIPEAIEYYYEMTTWYGQVVKISKTLNIGLKPVEVALDPTDVTISANMQFTTEAESLKKLYDEVANVDKEKITAAQYLKGIFGTEGLELRDKGFLANDKERQNTRLSVLFDNPEFACATFDYLDFDDVAPWRVNYYTKYTTWYGQEFVITKVVDFKSPGFDFKHNSNYVWMLSDNEFYSQVQPEYTWNAGDETQGIVRFSVADVKLLSAFDVVDADGKSLSYQDRLALALHASFELEQPEMGSLDPGIVINRYTETDSTGKQTESFNLAYYGGDDKADVYGKLVIRNNNDTEYVIPTSFDKEGKYESYFVQKFNPVNTPYDLPVPLVDIKNSDMYYVNVLEYIKLTDNRSNGRPSYDLIKDGAWVVGDCTNGFYKDKSVLSADIYGINPNWITKINLGNNKDIERFISFNNGILTFDNRQQLELTGSFDVKVQLQIKNVWMKYPETVEVTVTFNPVTVKPSVTE